MKTYLPSLDGLRALSIAFVIYSHLSSANEIPSPLKATSLGLDGVLIFFVLSGYLITSNLLKEWNSTSTINIKSFIIQRAFRLLPASFALITVAALFSHFGFVRLSSGDVLHAITYTTDYFQKGNVALIHLWSLSVEEQFYLLWPFSLLCLTSRSAWKVCFCALLLCPFSRLITWHFVGDGLIAQTRRFDDVADSLAVGCLLALYQQRLPKWTRSNRAVVLSLALIIASGLVGSRFPGFLVLHVSIASFGAAVVINSLTNPELVVAKAFSWRPIAWVGTLSYSLYLWQQLFTLVPLHKSLISKFPYDVLEALACASVSFYFLERPVRAWGRRFRSPSRDPRQAASSAIESAVLTQPDLI